MHFEKGKEVKLFTGATLALLMVSGCGGGSDGEPPETPLSGTQGSNQALLGPLSGATITAFKFENPAMPIEGPFTASSHDSNLELAGTFDLELTGVPDDQWILVTATGGQDIDVDDDGVVDTSPTANQGTIHALARAADWRSGANINLLTEVAYQAVKETPSADLDSALQFATTGLLGDDINNDSALDYRDLLAFTPYQSEHITATAVDYSQLLESLSNLIHTAASTTSLNEAINSLFGDSIKPISKIALTNFNANVSMPANAKGLTAMDTAVSSFVGGGDAIVEASGGSLLIAEDQEGRTLLLGYALPEPVAQASINKASSYAASSQESKMVALETSAAAMMNASNTEISPRSTALALVMMSISVNGESASTSIAAQVLAHPDFPTLHSLVQDAFVNDPYFLDQLAYYTAIRELVSNLANEVFQSHLSSLENRQAAASKTLSTAHPSVRSLSVPTDAMAQSTLGETFWLTSPWNNGEPWVWYGETNSFDVTLPPFPALSLSQPSLVASANPTMMNYVLEMYDESGAKIAGPDGRDWYLVGRNSTLIQRAVNSHAAQTLHNPAGIFANRPAHIEYNKFWLTSGDTVPTNIVRTLNILHLGSGIINVVADAKFITSYLKRTEELLGSSGNREELIDIFIVCGTGLVSTVDFTSDSIPTWIKDNSLSVLETSTTSCLLPLVEFYGKDAMKEAVNSFLTGALSKVLGKFSNPAGWGVIVFDAANDLAPFGISMFKADAIVGYDLSYNDDGQLVNATRNDKRPSVPLRPQANLDVLSVDGLSVTLSAGGSNFDQSANPGFEWGFGDGNVGSGETISHTYNSAGLKDIRLTVYDGLGQQSEVYTQVELTDGQPPVIQSFSCTVFNSTVSATVQLVDADDNNRVTVDWYPNASLINEGPVYSGITDSAGIATAALNYGFAAEQYYPVVKATDPRGNQAFESCATRISSVESYELQLNASGDGGFTYTVASSDVGGACSGSCNVTFEKGAKVTINPQAANGHIFEGWGGACSGYETCTVVMDQPRTVSASFNAFDLTITESVAD